MFIAKSNINHDKKLYAKGDDVSEIPKAALDILVADGVVEEVGKKTPAAEVPKATEAPKAEAPKATPSKPADLSGKL